MRKELIVAIVFGILFGCLIGYGIWRTNTKLQAKDLSSDEATLTQAASQGQIPTPPQELQVELTNVEENEVFDTNSITVSGLTQPNIWVAIGTEKKDYITKSDNDGLFHEKIELTFGANSITVTVFDINSNARTLSTNVIYSTRFANNTNSQEVTTQPLQDKIKDVMRTKPRAYIGVVTDKTDTSLQITNLKGEILLVSVDTSNISVVKVTDGTQKDAVFADVAIGDSIAAIGFIGSNELLEAKSIVLETFYDTLHKAIIGEIVDYSKRQLSIRLINNTEHVVAPTTSTVVSQGEAQNRTLYTDLEEGQTIIAIGTLSNSTLSARRIQVVE
jgi:hypothetical protein